MRQVMTEMAQKFPREDVTLSVYAPPSPPRKIGIAHLDGQTGEVTYTPEKMRLEHECAHTRRVPTSTVPPQIMATEVVRLPPMLKVRNFFAPSIWRAPAWSVSC